MRLLHHFLCVYSLSLTMPPPPNPPPPSTSSTRAGLTNHAKNGQSAAVRIKTTAGGGGDTHFDNSALIARDASNVNEKTNMIEEERGADGVAHPLPVRPSKGALHNVAYTRLRKFDDSGPGNACGGEQC